MGLTADFLIFVESGKGGRMIREAAKATGEFAEPIWKAYELEGSKNFNAPRQVGGPLANTCHKGGCADGSPWTISAQVLASLHLP